MTESPSTQENQPSFEEAFRIESQGLLLERSRTLVFAAAILYPLFWFLDLAMVSGDQARLFLWIRFAVAGFMAFAIAVTYTRWRDRLSLPAFLAATYLAALGISYMAVRMGGFDSDYYVGNMIVLMAVGLFMPLRPLHAVVLCCAIVITYLAMNAEASAFTKAAAAPFSFLVGTSAFTCLATLTSYRTRRRDLALRLQVERANDDLREMHEARTRFFANVSHELRTPLTLILAPVEGMLRREASGETRELLKTMASNARRLLRQVNALLQVAKLEAGRLRLKPEASDLAALLNELVDAARPLATQRGIDLRIEGLDEEVGEIRFDRDKVEVVAANLLSNAVKFTPSGGRIVVRRVEAAEDRVAFEVADTGPGIPADELERVFDRFHQVDGSLSRAQEGTGLGLALARELSRMHGGELTVRSVLGEGSTFTVELPRVPSDTFVERRKRLRRKEDRMLALRADAEVARGLEERQQTIGALLADVEQPELQLEASYDVHAPSDAPLVLVVDDNRDLRTFVVSQLRAEYRVEWAENGEAGLEAARRLHPDIVVSDVMMPVMDGCEMTRRMREEPSLKATPVILVTARAGAEAVVEGLDVGADDYVTKPFDMRELEARLKAHLRARRLERSLDERETRLAAIGRMASEIVHDLKTPLSAVIGFADIAQTHARMAEREEIAEDLQPVIQEGERLGRMLEEVLDFARGGRARIVTTPTPAFAWLKKVLDSLEADLGLSRIELRREIDIAPDVSVELDADRMHRVLENLISNARDAIRAHRKRERRVQIDAHVLEGRLRVRIADSGTGIPEDLLATIFEPFVTAGKAKGTGLGLATVRNLVVAHGGDIEVEAQCEVGGAAFTISLPCKVDAAMAAAGA